jgi:hypothetical protein
MWNVILAQPKNLGLRKLPRADFLNFAGVAQMR